MFDFGTWKIVCLTGIASEHQAVLSPPTYSSPTDRWANSALPQSMFWEVACEKKASESSCKVKHIRVLTRRFKKSADTVQMEAAFQTCLGKAEQFCMTYVSSTLPPGPLQLKCLMNLCTPSPLAIGERCRRELALKWRILWEIVLKVLLKSKKVVSTGFTWSIR